MDDRSEFIHVANKLVRLIQNQKIFSKFGRVLVRNASFCNDAYNFGSIDGVYALS